MASNAWKWWLATLGATVFVTLVAMGMLYFEGHAAIAEIVGITVAAAAWLMAAGAIFSYARPEWPAWWTNFALIYGAKVLGAGALFFMDFTPAATLVLVGGTVLELTIIWWAVAEHRTLRLGAMVLFGGCYAATIAWFLTLIERQDLGLLVLGAAGLLAAYAMALWLARTLLIGANPVIGIARTVMDEAIRMRVGLIIIVALAIILVELVRVPADDRLDFQITRLLTSSLMWMSMLLGVLMLLLGCSTIGRDMDQKHIFLTMTKPVSRPAYLAGKWLGLVVLSAVLVAVSGLAIWVLAEATMHRHDGDAAAYEQARREVLTARKEVLPEPRSPERIEQQVERILEQRRREREARGEGPLTERDREEARQSAITAWHTIGPQNRETFIFTGLERARERGESVYLRMKPRRSQVPQADDDSVAFEMRINDRPYLVQAPGAPRGMTTPVIQTKDDAYREFFIPAERISEGGRLEVELLNISPTYGPQAFGDLRFDPGEGMVLLSPAGSFEGNLARAMVILWLQMGLLAAIALMSASFLSFQVALLLSGLVAAAGMAREYLNEALRYYPQPLPGLRDDFTGWFTESLGMIAETFANGAAGEGLNLVVRMVITLMGKFVATVMPSLGAFSPIGEVSSGRLVSTMGVAEAALWLWLIWGGVCAVIALFAFGRRELARITVA